MGQRFLPEPTYVWNWSSLTGSVQALLRFYELPDDGPQISATLGEAFRVRAVAAMSAPPAFQARAYPPRSLRGLTADLRVLGLSATVLERNPPGSWQRGPWQRRPWLLTRRIKRRLNRGQPVIAFGAGVDEFGLLAGYDDARRAFWREGPLTHEIGRWLPYTALRPGGPNWLAVVLAEKAPPHPQRVAVHARTQALTLAASAEGTVALERWASILAGEREVDMQGHAYWVQALAAARGEAAQFWRREAALQPALARAAQAVAQEALTLSRLSSMFPFPAGGDVNPGGLRNAAASILRAAAAQEGDAMDALAAASLPE